MTTLIAAMILTHAVFDLAPAPQKIYVDEKRLFALEGTLPLVLEDNANAADMATLAPLYDALGFKPQVVPASTYDIGKRAIYIGIAGQNAAFDTANGDRVWAGWRQMGGWWPTTEAPAFPTSTPALPATLNVGPASFDGNPEQYPFLLYPYPSAVLGDGRGAAASWLQEAPDPMTTASWDTWVEINPDTAASMGIAMDDVVKVISPHGEITAIAYLYRGIRPDVVAVPLGQGHLEFGRFAKDRGANVAAILAPVATPDGELAWASTRVRIEKLGRRQKLPRLENNVGVDTANQYDVFPG